MKFSIAPPPERTARALLWPRGHRHFRPCRSICATASNSRTRSARSIPDWHGAGARAGMTAAVIADADSDLRLSGRIQPEPALIGTTPQERAATTALKPPDRARRFLCAMDALSNTTKGMKGRRFPGPHNYEQNPELAARGRAQGRVFFPRLGRALAGREFVGGARYTIATSPRWCSRTCRLGQAHRAAGLRRFPPLACGRLGAARREGIAGGNFSTVSFGANGWYLDTALARRAAPLGRQFRKDLCGKRQDDLVRRLTIRAIWSYSRLRSCFRFSSSRRFSISATIAPSNRALQPTWKVMRVSSRSPWIAILPGCNTPRRRSPPQSGSGIATMRVSTTKRSACARSPA